MKKGKVLITITVPFLILSLFLVKAGALSSMTSPGVYVEEVPSNPVITPVETSVAGFLGQTEKGPVDPQLISSYEEYEELYGGNPQGRFLLPYSVKGFFENGGNMLYIARVCSQSSQNIKLPVGKISRFNQKTISAPLLKDYLGNQNEDEGTATGLYALGLIDEITILYSPEAQNVPGLGKAMAEQCKALKDRVVILESALAVTDPKPLEEFNSSYAVFYSPWLKITDDSGTNKLVPPGGFIAGTFVQTDYQRGVHKAPANVKLQGVTGLERAISRSEQDRMNLNRVNPIILKTGLGFVANGAKTLSSDPEYTYLHLRRYINYINESISESLDYLALEIGSSTLNSEIKQAVESFLLQEWQNGALMGNYPRDAFYVLVYSTNVTIGGDMKPALAVQVGVSLIRPAEFHIVHVVLVSQ